jgi:hypothetical protein
MTLELTGVLMEKVWAMAEAASATGTRSLENIILESLGLGVRWVVSGLRLWRE